MKSGLYARAGISAVATAAACASLLEDPATKVSKVYFGFSREVSSCFETGAPPPGRAAPPIAFKNCGIGATDSA